MSSEFVDRSPTVTQPHIYTMIISRLRFVQLRQTYGALKAAYYYYYF